MNEWPLGLILAVMFAGFVFWLLDRDHRNVSSLGAAVVTGAGISLAFFFLQQSNDENIRNTADRQTLRLALAQKRNLSGADLRGDDLRDFDLGLKDLSQADLAGANLDGAQLAGTNLKEADLTGAQLRNAKLTGADLRGANLNGTDFSAADLRSAHLEGARLGVSHGHPTILRGAIVIDAHMRGACLASANLRGALLGGVDLRDAVLTGADLTGAVLVNDGIPITLSGAFVAGAKVDPKYDDLMPRKTVPPPAMRASQPDTFRTDKVVQTNDGDTLRLEKLGWVRLIGLNAPNGNAPFGIDARGILNQFLDSVVAYQLGPKPREKRPGGVGRSLAYLWASDGRLINALPLTEGLAVRERTQGERPAYAALMDVEELRAKGAGLGLWSICP